MKNNMNFDNPFLIRLVKDIRFSNNGGRTIKCHKKGTILKAIGITDFFYVTRIGGVYFNEAEKVKEKIVGDLICESVDD